MKTAFDLPQKVYDNFQIVGHIPITEKLRLEVAIFAVNGIVQVRVFQQYCKLSGEWKYSMKSLSVPIRKPVNGEIVEPSKMLAEMILNLQQMAHDFPLEDIDNEVWIPRRPTEEELIKIQELRRTRNRHITHTKVEGPNGIGAVYVRKAQNP